MDDNRRRLSDIPEDERRKPKKIPLKLVLAIGKEDVLLASFALLTLMIHWMALNYFSSFDNVFTFSDVPLTFSYGDDPQDEIYTIYLGPQNKRVSYPLPFYYIYIKTLRTLCFGSKSLTLVISNILNVAISTIAFKKMLKFGRISRDVGFSTILFIFIPLRHVVFFFTPTIDSFFMTLVIITFLFDITQRETECFIFGILACLTKPEGVIILLSLVPSKIQKGKTINGVFSFILYFIFLITFALTIPYIRTALFPPLPEQGYIVSRFLSFLRHQCLSISNLRQIHGVTPFLGCTLIGGVLTLDKNLGLGVFSLIYVVYLSFLVTKDPFRVGLPGYSISLICGFNAFLTSKNVRFAILLISPFICLVEIYYYCATIAYDQKNSDIWKFNLV